MTRLLAAMLLAAAMASPAAAQDEGRFRLGADLFTADDAVTVDDTGLDDVFAAGERVDLAAPIAGTAHLAGRRVEVRGDVGGALYAAGADVNVAAPVAGSANLAGYDVDVSAAVNGNLRVAASNVRVAGPVAGTALIGAGDVTIDAVISGDAAIGTDDLAFGPDARIGGRLTLYGKDAARLEVPASVIPADRIERRTIHDHRSGTGPRPLSWIGMAGAFLIWVIVVAVLAGLVAAVAPAGMERMRAIAGARPVRTWWIGFLTLSALVGSIFVLGATLLGLLAAPVILLALAILGLLGYLIGVYLLGSLIWSRFDRDAYHGLWERLLIAAVGAVAAALIGLIPFVGWLALYIIGLIGLGALAVAIFRPQFDT